MVFFECGNGDIDILNKMLNHLKKWNIKIYVEDNWKSYAESIPENILIQSKKKAHSIETNNAR